MAVVEYDDTQLQRLFSEMDIKTRTKALKGAFRREATKVRKVAVNNLRSSGLRTSRGLEKGIKSSVFKQSAGFKVTIGGSMYKNTKGKSKPVLIFAEAGTKERYTKSRGLLGRGRKGHYTGKMPRYAFMTKTKSDVTDSVTQELHEEVTQSVINTARKYGCI